MSDETVEAQQAEGPAPARTSFLQRIEHNWIEIAAAALMALATMMSAFSAYQSATWQGRAEEQYSKSDQHLIQATELNDKANQQMAIDAAMVSNYLNAVYEGKTDLASTYQKSAFSPELQKALEAWLVAVKTQGDKAPKNPFKMPEYKLPARVESTRRQALASVEAATGKTAIDHANSYLLLTVLFASVLFFAGIGTKFNSKGVKLGVMGMGVLLFICAVSLLAVQP